MSKVALEVVDVCLALVIVAGVDVGFLCLKLAALNGCLKELIMLLNADYVFFGSGTCKSLCVVGGILEDCLTPVDVVFDDACTEGIFLALCLINS